MIPLRHFKGTEKKHDKCMTVGVPAETETWGGGPLYINKKCTTEAAYCKHVLSLGCFVANHFAASKSSPSFSMELLFYKHTDHNNKLRVSAVFLWIRMLFSHHDRITQTESDSIALTRMCCPKRK
jgi:hypothetical protein